MFDELFCGTEAGAAGCVRFFDESFGFGVAELSMIGQLISLGLAAEGRADEGGNFAGEPAIPVPLRLGAELSNRQNTLGESVRCAESRCIRFRSSLISYALLVTAAN